MKQTDFKQVSVSGKKFSLRPMPALKASNLSGELFKLLAPLAGMVASIIKSDDADKLSDEEMGTKVVEGISTMISSSPQINGDEVEKMMRKLLLSGYVVVETEKGTDGEYLDEDILNEVFCCDIMGMYTLCYHVIKLNFGDFFEKLAHLYGAAM